jgi:hypothetical protein
MAYESWSARRFTIYAAEPCPNPRQPRERPSSASVMAGLVPAIHAFLSDAL